MNDRENQNQGRQGQQEQANAGGSMREDDEEFGENSRQMEQQGGTYRPEGDRGLDFESDDSGRLGMGQAEQQTDRRSQGGEPGRSRQQGGSDQSRQQEQSDSDRSRRDRQQGEWDSEDEDI